MNKIKVSRCSMKVQSKKGEKAKQGESDREEKEKKPNLEELVQLDQTCREKEPKVLQSRLEEKELINVITNRLNWRPLHGGSRASGLRKCSRRISGIRNEWMDTLTSFGFSFKGLGPTTKERTPSPAKAKEEETVEPWQKDMDLDKLRQIRLAVHPQVRLTQGGVKEILRHFPIPKKSSQIRLFCSTSKHISLSGPNRTD